MDVPPLLSSKELFSGKKWRITLDEAPLPDGRVKKAARAHRPDTVHILAFPTQETVLMLKEFRPFYGKYLWMIPSGKMDKESDPLEAAQRELREETGFRAEEINFYCMARHSDSLDTACHIFIARTLSKDPLPQDADELIEVHALPIDDAINRVLQDDFVHSATAYALLRYAREHHL